MSKEWKCHKRSFPDRKEALKAIHDTNHGKSPVKSKKKCRPYECIYCGQYHLTSLSKKESKRVKKYQKQKGLC